MLIAYVNIIKYYTGYLHDKPQIYVAVCQLLGGVNGFVGYGREVMRPLELL